MNYWFYLEPYSFIFHAGDQSVIYNTLNGAYLPCPSHPVVNTIVEKWKDARNGYGVSISDTDLNDARVKEFVTAIRESFSGDCIAWNESKPKPYLFKPDLYLNTAIRKISNPFYVCKCRNIRRQLFNGTS